MISDLSYDTELLSWLKEDTWEESIAIQLLAGFHPQDIEDLKTVIAQLHEERYRHRIGAIAREENAIAQRHLQWIVRNLRKYKFGIYIVDKYCDLKKLKPMSTEETSSETIAHKLICLKRDPGYPEFNLEICNQMMKSGLKRLTREFRNFQKHPDPFEYSKEVGMDWKMISYVIIEAKSRLRAIEELIEISENTTHQIILRSPEDWIEWGIENDYWPPWLSEAIREFNISLPLNVFQKYYTRSKYDESGKYQEYDIHGKREKCGVCHHWEKFNIKNEKASTNEGCPLCAEWFFEEKNDPDGPLYLYEKSINYSRQLAEIVKFWEKLQHENEEIRSPVEKLKKIIQKKYPAISTRALNNMAKVGNWKKNDGQRRARRCAKVTDKLIAKFVYGKVGKSEQNKNMPAFLDSSHENYPYELAAAVTVWIIMLDTGNWPSKYKEKTADNWAVVRTYKQAVWGVLFENYAKVMNDLTRGRIATVINYNIDGKLIENSK